MAGDKKPIKIKILTKKGASNKPHIQPKSGKTQPDSKLQLPTYLYELKPFIDKLSVVVTPSDQDAHDIYKAFFQHLDDDELFKDAGTVKGPGFTIAKRIILPSIKAAKKLPLLQIKHLKQQELIPKLRLDFVPVDLGPNGMMDLHIALMTIMDSGWEFVVKHGRVTRIDVAIDLPQLCMDSVHLLPKKAAHTQHWLPSGELETIYIGKPKSNQIAIYDRRQ